MSFLNVEEISGKALQFKDEWFYLAQRIESMGNYNSGFERGFAESLEDVQARASGLANLLENICISCQKYTPERKSEFESKRNKIQKPLRGLAAAAGEDAKAIRAHSELLLKLRELSANLEAVKKDYEERRSRAQKACEKRAVLKHDYEKKIQSIKSATDEAMEKLRRTFLYEMSAVLEGYAIIPRGGDREITPELLFEEFTKDPEYHNQIEIKAKGISGMLARKGGAKARLMLFRYKAEETYGQIAPMLEEEKRKIAKFEGDLTVLEELQRRCEALRKEEEGALSQVKNLEKSDEELRRKEEVLSKNFAGYERVLDLREAYLKKLNETGEARKGLLSLVESMRGAELQEQDVEKRELRGEIKALRENAIKLQNEGAELQEQLKSKIARELDLGRLVEEYKSKEKALREDLARLRDAKAKLEGERAQLRMQLEIRTASEAQLNKNLSEARERDKALRESAAKFKVENGELKARLKGTAEDLGKTLNRLDAELKNKGKLEDENRRLKAELEETMSRAKQE